MMTQVIRLVAAVAEFLGQLMAGVRNPAGLVLAVLVVAVVIVMAVVGVSEIVQAILALGIVIICIMLAAGQ